MMEWTMRLWRFSVTLAILDVDTSNQDMAFSVTISWKKAVK